VPLVKCDSNKCSADRQNARLLCEYGSIAVAPSTADDVGGYERAVEFRRWLWQKYPIATPERLAPIVHGQNDVIAPATAKNASSSSSSPLYDPYELVKVFESSDDIDAAVRDVKYGSSGSPKIIMGIVFEGNSTTDYRYTLRQNSTNFNAPEKEGRPAARTSPDTARRFNSFIKTDLESCATGPETPRLGPMQESCTGQYAYNGILTFQRLVDDYILDRTTSNATGTEQQQQRQRHYFVSEGGVQFTTFPTREFVVNGFYSTIKSKCRTVYSFFA